MDGHGGQAYDLTHQFAIDDRAIGPAGSEVEDRLEEIVRSILVSCVEDGTLDVGDRQRTEVSGSGECRKVVGIASRVIEVHGVLR